MESLATRLLIAAMGSRAFVKIQLKNTMKVKIPEFNLEGAPLVLNEKVEACLTYAFNDPLGGIKVFTSPQGSGKTTYIRRYANRFIGEGGHVRFFGSELKSVDDFFLAFGDAERRRDLFDVIPIKSAIIIDQLDYLGTPSADFERLIRHLALESRRTAECNIILLLSNCEIAKRVLSLNGLDKINAGGKAADFEWNKQLISTYVDEICNRWSADDRSTMKTLGNIARCPIFLHGVLTAYPLGLPHDKVELHNTAKLYDKEWNKYASIGL